ncbi:MAG: Ig-like domain-containing protein [Terracidiphilus sp.]
MRGLIRRGLRLELIAGLGIALSMPALAVAAESEQTLATQTTLSAETRDQGGSTQAAVAISVNGEDGLPATGAVTISDQGKLLAGLALNAQGQAKAVLDLPGGDHLLRAVYAGDATHKTSVSGEARVQATVTAPPDFQIFVAPAALTLTPGDAGTITVTIKPVNNAGLTAPMSVTLSCSGLPDEASCNFTPENPEILSTTPISCPAGSAASACPPTSTMVIQTLAESTASATRHSAPIAWAFLLPGVLGLGGLAWGARRSRLLRRLSLMALLGLITLLGATACNPRYAYEHHGPVPNPPTPAGTYTIIVTGQSSNGVTAITHNTTLALTVN